LPSFTTVVGASGRLLKVVNWTSDAWVQIQNERPDWVFMLAEFEKGLTNGKNQYDPSLDWALTPAKFLPDTCNRLTMSLYDPLIGKADEGFIRQISYDQWRDRWNFGVQTQNRPVEWAISPTGLFCVGPTPNKVYSLRGQYHRIAQVLALDTDVPIIPAQFHNVIVAEALRNMADSDEEYEGLKPKAEKYEAVRNAMVLSQTPQVYRF
jgi:hypothetical protein